MYFPNKYITNLSVIKSQFMKYIKFPKYILVPFQRFVQKSEPMYVETVITQEKRHWIRRT